MDHSAEVLDSTHGARAKLEQAIGHLSRLVAEQDDDPEHIDPRELVTLRDELAHVLIDLDCIRMLEGTPPAPLPPKRPKRRTKVIDLAAERARRGR